MNNKNIITYILIALIAGTLGFFVGQSYGQNPNSSRNLASRARQNLMMGSGSITAGKIISRDERSLTLQLREAGSKIIFFSSSTAITKTTSGFPADLEAGQQVAVTGNSNQDGSISASTIQIRSASSSPFNR